MSEQSRPGQTPSADKTSQQSETSMPGGAPPMGASGQGGESGETRPRDLNTDEMTMITSAVSGDTMPSLTPPQQTRSGVGAGSIGAWTNYRKVTALWSINQNRNSWIYLENVGWRKLANNSDSAIVALSILAAHAKQTQTPYYNGREEADGMIYECYVW